jgi:citronellol/citronellal dehydrogenase
MTLKDKTIIITGASQGLGETLAYKTAEEGAHVILIARTEKLLKKITQSIIKKEGTADYFVCDIRDENATRETLSAILKKLGLSIF